ncbi:hypothetical protein E2562_021600 [Oryza meyeriana var. granulata]|uniref:Uncharacterized protein n=1 Tax=Oryza meyeriana var. granulata TaxID=110450 RepID=A0A6G1EC69_9ORYZ|nr:hypothetical protein E2562_021600 [Oryza meyeriana var. granulata]
MALALVIVEAAHYQVENGDHLRMGSGVQGCRFAPHAPAPRLPGSLLLATVRAGIEKAAAAAFAVTGNALSQSRLLMVHTAMSL